MRRFSYSFLTHRITKDKSSHWSNRIRVHFWITWIEIELESIGNWIWIKKSWPLFDIMSMKELILIFVLGTLSEIFRSNLCQWILLYSKRIVLVQYQKRWKFEKDFWYFRFLTVFICLFLSVVVTMPEYESLASTVLLQTVNISSKELIEQNSTNLSFSRKFLLLYG